MNRFKQFQKDWDEFRKLPEAKSGKGLTIFDIDETMFKTKALVLVVKDGKTVKKLNNQEFNKYCV